MNTTKTVFPLALSDAALCADLHLACFGDAAWNTEQFASSLSLPTSFGWRIHANDQPAGLILLQNMTHEAEILTFGVIPEHRRQGLGDHLLAHALENIRRSNSTTIFLDVAEDNVDAVHLYQKHHFQMTGKRPNYYNRLSGPMTALMFRLIFTST
jgi:ribosomal-protein-alanine N-acetyltransferase